MGAVRFPKANAMNVAFGRDFLTSPLLLTAEMKVI